jgi:hypothetical protein
MERTKDKTTLGTFKNNVAVAQYMKESDRK